MAQDTNKHKAIDLDSDLMEGSVTLTADAFKDVVVDPRPSRYRRRTPPCSLKDQVQLAKFQREWASLMKK
jgi:hypothetical protein